MTAYSHVFKKAHTFLAVIHVVDAKQVMRNVHIARRNGADGVFLINHDVDVAYLLDCYDQVRSRHTSYWIGLNLLGKSALDARTLIPENASGLWTDNAGIHDDHIVDDAFEMRKRNSRWSGVYFGGVAFKHQQPVKNLEAIARRAAPYVDVITTSGDATGEAPMVEKIRELRHGAGNHPIAIASGMTPDNVRDFMPYANCFIVATGISNSHSELNASLVKKFSHALQ